MYNESIKIAFVQNMITSISTIKSYKRLFEISEKHEIALGKDLCEFNQEEYKLLMSDLTSVRSLSQYAEKNNIKKYIEWCKTNTSFEVSNAIYELNSVDLNKIRSSMVSGPTDLQNSLDSFLQPTFNHSHEDVFRGFLWLAFMGFPQSRVVELKTDDVDFIRNAIKNGDKWVAMPDESHSAFYNLATLKTFKLYNSFYKFAKYTIFERDDNDLLLRLKNGEKFNSVYLRNQFSKIQTVASKRNLLTKRLTFDKVALSGIFYRKYQDELKVKMSGVLANGSYIPDFTEEALAATADKTYSSKYQYSASVSKFRRGYEKDYENWKEAFGLK